MEEAGKIKEGEGLSSEQILSKLKDLFGEEVANAFEAEDITCCNALNDLVDKDADSTIFGKLGLNYGKACRFKDEFRKILPRRKDTPYTSPRTRTLVTKPTMGDMASFSPELRRLYLSKRKRVGVLASEHWGNKYPKFNTPERKAELAKFASNISNECSLTEAGFSEQGIQQHIKDFFSEQRRYMQRRKGELRSSSEDTDDCLKFPCLPFEIKKERIESTHEVIPIVEKEAASHDHNESNINDSLSDNGGASDKTVDLSDEEFQPSCSQISTDRPMDDQQSVMKGFRIVFAH